MKYSKDKIIRDQQETLTAFRKCFNAKSNMEALDRIEELTQAIRDMYSDSVKYPQLELHEYHQKRLERMLKLITRSDYA